LRDHYIKLLDPVAVKSGSTTLWVISVKMVWARRSDHFYLYSC